MLRPLTFTAGAFLLCAALLAALATGGAVGPWTAGAPDDPPPVLRRLAPRFEATSEARPSWLRRLPEDTPRHRLPDDGIYNNLALLMDPSASGDQGFGAQIG